MLHTAKKDIANIWNAVFNIENVEIPNGVPIPCNQQALLINITTNQKPLHMNIISNQNFTTDGPCRSTVQASGILKHIVIHYHLQKMNLAVLYIYTNMYKPPIVS